MTLMNALGYEVEPQDGLKRRLSELAANEAANVLIARTAMPLDRFVLWATSGRWTATALVAGLPVLWLATTGARSKLTRQVPLLGIPTPSQNLAVLGTNFGGERSPGWVHNLVAHPEAVATWRDNSVAVTAVQLEPEAQEPIWERAIAAYPGFANYRANAEERTIRIFELSPADK